MHAFLVSAAHKSSGKTTLTIGLAAELRRRGLAVQPFKKGPDYIDPLWLSAAAGRACRNLDFYTSGREEIASAFVRHAGDAQVAIVEGNKGLYDGLDLDGSNSNAALARLLELPVVLVLDARGMTRGVAPLLLGYRDFDRALRFAGVVLNRLGGDRHEAKLRAVIEHYTDLRVLGAVHENPAMAIPERHLGLVPENEAQGAAATIEAIRAAVAREVDIDALLAVTLRPPLVPAAARADATGPAPAARPASVTVAVARDRAFGFYYAEDFEAFERAGARLAFFDTLRDARLPACDAVFIGGGFPECFLEALAANAPLRAELRARLAGGLPAYAECGGLMYLARSIDWHGRRAPMVGAIPADVVMRERPTGRGYVRLRVVAGHPWGLAAGREIRAHEFHYSTLVEGEPARAYCYEVLRGHGIDGAHDGLRIGNLLASYTHLRATADFDWPAHFVAFVHATRSPAAAAG